MNAESKFAATVSAFTHGGRYDNYLRVVRLGLIAQNGDAEAVFDYIMANSPPPRPNPAKVRDAIRYALDHDRATPGDRRRHFTPELSEAERRERRRILLPAPARQFVPVTLRDFGRTATADTIGDSIHMTDADLHLDEAEYRRQAARQLRALHPGGRIWAGTIAEDADGKTRKTPFAGNGIIDADDLADRIEAGVVAIPTHISLNPQTGRAGTTTKGTPSFDCLATVAAFRHVLIEFDNLKDADGTPSKEQAEIIAGLLDRSANIGDLMPICAVYTGGKSIHVALRVKADDLAAYRRQCAALADLFASADDPRFRCDTSAWTTGANAATHIRLAGAIRPETGRRARLLSAGERNLSAPSPSSPKPLPPQEMDTTDLAEILAEVECIEAWAAAGHTPGA